MPVEPARAVLGGVPIFLSVINTYGSLRKEIPQGPSLGSYDTIATQLNLQFSIFKNTLARLLSEATEQAPTEVQHSINRAAVGETLDLPTEHSLRSYLGDDYNSLIELNEQIILDFAAAARSLYSYQTDNESKIAKRVRWSYRDREQLNKSLHVINTANKTLQAIIENLTVTRQAARTLLSAVEATGDDGSGFDDSSETDSISTVETTPDTDTAWVKFLTINITIPKQRSTALQQRAGLDTWATKCCISEEIAESLSIEESLREPDEGAFSIPGAVVWPQGKVKLKFRWNSAEGAETWEKRYFYIIPGLPNPVILSNEFQMNHPEVMALAENIDIGDRHLNPLVHFGFRPNAAERKRQAEELQKINDANKAKADQNHNQMMENLRRDMYSEPGQGNETQESTSSTSQTMTRQDSASNSSVGQSGPSSMQQSIS